MFHKRCDKLIADLEERCKYLEELNEQLIRALGETKGVVLGYETQGGSVHYMDDARMKELEDATDS
jgi:hypothetical protein